jgi:WD40 repeat protein
MPYATPPPSFQREVLPILRTACLGCHAAPSPAGGISLASYADLMKGGKSGAAIVPGKSGSSRLVQMMAGTVKPQMPPTGSLKASDVDVIRRWADAGAKDDLPIPLKSTPGKAGSISSKSAAVTASLSSAIASVRPVGKLLNIAAPVQSLAFSPDGNMLAVGTYQKVLLCDPVTRQVTSVWGGHTDSVRSVAFSPDGKWLAAGGGTSGAFGDARLWNVVARRAGKTLASQTDAVNAVAFSPDGKLLAAASADKSVQIWDAASGKPLQTLRDHADSVLGLAFRADGKYMASCGADKSFKIWDTVTWKRLYTIGAHEEPVTALAFNSDNSLLSAGADRVAKVWNVAADNASSSRTLGGHEKPVLCVAVSQDGQFAVTGSADNTVKLWKIGDGSNLATFTDAKDWVYAVRFSPDGKRLAAGTWNGQVYLWNIETRKLEGAFSTLRPER